MQRMNLPRLRFSVPWLAGFLLLGLALSALSDDKYDGECPPCTEWDAYEQDCAPVYDPQPGPCYELNTNCEWEEIDPGDQPGPCYELNGNCEWVYTPGAQPSPCFELVDCLWVEVDPGDSPGECYEYDDVTCAWVLTAGDKPPGCFELIDCEWVETDPPPEPEGDCLEYDAEACDWIEKDPGPPPGPCHELNANCEWEEIDPGDQPGPCFELVNCEWTFTGGDMPEDGCYQWNEDICDWEEEEQEPKPDGCWQWVETACMWLPSEPPEKPGRCFDFDDDACVWIPKDPGPKPGDCYFLDDNCEWYHLTFPKGKPKGCYLLDTDTCKWEEYTPNCDAEAKKEHDLRERLAAKVDAMAQAAIQLDKLHKWCKCTTGSFKEKAYWCLQLPPDSAIPPDDPCGDEKKKEKRVLKLLEEIDQLTAKLLAAAKALEDCENCIE